MLIDDIQLVQSCPVDRRPFSVIYLQGSSQQCIKVRCSSDVLDICLEGSLMKPSLASLCFSFLWKCPGCQSRTCAVVKTLRGCVMSVCKCRHAACAWVCSTAYSSIWIFLLLFVSLAGTRQKKPRECKRKELMSNRNTTILNVCIIVFVLFKMYKC